MIRIHHPRLDEWAMSLYHEFFVKQGYEARLEACAKESHWNPDQAEFLCYLLEKSEVIITGRPNRLAEIVDHIKQTYKGKRKIFDVLKISKTNKCQLKSSLQEIFNYSAFTAIDPPKWGAYALTERLQVSVCPYCNRQFTTTYHSKSGRTRPQLDHFYDKGTHPYLAISFFNLIPSCYVCNANFKGKKLFTLKTHLHPYNEGFGQHRKFGVDFKQTNDEIDYVGIFEGKVDGFDIVFRDDPTMDKHDLFWERANNNCTVFKISELYNEHKDYVSDLILKARVYNEDHIRQLYSTFPELFPTETDVLRLISGASLSEDDYPKKTLSKLTTDLMEDLKLRFT